MRDTLSDLNIQLYPHCILENMLTASRQLDVDAQDVAISAVEELLQKTEDMGEGLLVHMQTRLNDANEELQTARQKFSTTRSSLNELEQKVNATYGGCLAELEDDCDTSDILRRRTTDSASSGWTAVSESSAQSETSNKVVSEFASTLYPHSFSDSGVALPGGICETPHTAATFPPSTPPATKVLRPTKSMVDLGRLSDVAQEDKGFLKLFSSWTKEGGRPRSKTDSQANVEAANSSSSIWLGEPHEPVVSGMSRVKAWFKKKLMPEVAVLPAVAGHADSSTPSTDRDTTQEDGRGSTSESVQQRIAQSEAVSAINVVRVANRDLSHILEDIETAERYVSHTSKSIAQARQLLSRSLEVRLLPYPPSFSH